MTSLATTIHFFQSGGFFMYPILIILAVGTAIVLERLITLTRFHVKGEPFWEQIYPFLKKQSLDEALRNCSRKQTPLHHVLAAGIIGMKGANRRDDVQVAMDAAMVQVIPKVEARLHYLPSLANVATLMGLLGTIIGLIQAFTAVSLADPSQKAALLAKGISVAMNTTAFGLIVAVPLLLLHSLLQTRANGIIDTLEEYALRLLTLVCQTQETGPHSERTSPKSQGPSETVLSRPGTQILTGV